MLALFLLLLATPLFLYVLSLIVWHLAQYYYIYTSTGHYDLAQLRLPRQGKRLQGNAVICGGSIAGLLAAKVCAKHFERVIIVEPEAWLTTKEAMRVDAFRQTATRSRVMQYKSLQGSLYQLMRGLEAMFPNLHEECRKSEISILPAEYRNTISGKYLASPWKYIKTVAMIPFATRKGLETLIRRLVLSDSNTNIEQQVGLATGINFSSSDPTRIESVSVRTGDEIVNLPASLVIDCTGVARAGHKWLTRAGIPVKKVTINQNLNYATIMLRVPPALQARLPYPKAVTDMGSKPLYGFVERIPELGNRIFSMQADDGDCVTVFALRASETVPEWKTLDSMIEVARSLVGTEPVPEWVFEMMEMLKEVEEDASVSQLRILPSTWCQYHLARELPRNFIAMGDSAMSVNPTYGQGNGKAMLGAIALDLTLHGSTENGISAEFSKTFFEKLHTRTKVFWDGIRLLDYGSPWTVPMEGDKLSRGKGMRAYLHELQTLATESEWVSSLLTKSVHDLGTPIELVHPEVVRQVMWRWFKEGLKLSAWCVGF